MKKLGEYIIRVSVCPKNQLGDRMECTQDLTKTSNDVRGRDIGHGESAGEKIGCGRNENVCMNVWQMNVWSDKV